MHFVLVRLTFASNKKSRLTLTTGMTAPPKAAKVPYAEQNGISDVNIGRFMDNAQNRNLRQVSKAFNQAFFDNLKCADAKEL